MQSMSSPDLGLQSALEDGLALIRRQPLDDDRRVQVLDNLIEIFNEADRGSQALNVRDLLFAADDRPAFERFTLFFRYLSNAFGADVPTRLTEAAAVLTELRGGNAQDETQRTRVEELIEALLASMEREFSLFPLTPPREFRYG